MTPELGEPQSLVGRAVVDRGGSRFGEIEDVFVERGTDEPAFALISMGRFGSLGRRLTVVPLAGARSAEGDDEIVLAVDEDRVRSAPEFSFEAELSGEQEAEIEAYYDLDRSSGLETGELPGDGDSRPATEPAGSPVSGPAAEDPGDLESRGTSGPSQDTSDTTPGATAGPMEPGGGESESSAEPHGGQRKSPATAPSGGRRTESEGGADPRRGGLSGGEARDPATNGDGAAAGRSPSNLPEPPAEGVLVSEEQIEVSHTQAVRERVRLVKEIVVEDVQITVPLRREVLRLERTSVPDEPADGAEVVDDLKEEAFEVLLRTEEPVIGRRVVPVERVRVTKEIVTEDAEITEQLRKERVEVETIGET